MFLSLIILSPGQVSCSEEQWQNFLIEPVPSFEYPAGMSMSGAMPDEDDFDWTYTLKTKDGEFTIFSSGCRSAEPCKA